MAFNFIPYFADGWPESQLAEGGVNAADNCGGASGALVMMAYGYQDIEPQDWTNFEYGPSYHGGMTLESLVDFITKHYPDAPPMAIESPANVASAVATYGEQGFPCIGWFYCDSSANILQYPSSISHFSPLIAFDGNIFSVRNVWRGYINTFNPAQLNAASVGTILVFKRSLQIMTDEELKAFHDLLQFRAWGVVDTSPGSYVSFISAIKGGTSPKAILDGWVSSAPGVAWASKLANIGQAGPQGPKGDPGPAGPVNSTVPKHGHSGPISLNGSVDVI